jgi:hypothetical protein
MTSPGLISASSPESNAPKQADVARACLLKKTLPSAVDAPDDQRKFPNRPLFAPPIDITNNSHRDCFTVSPALVSVEITILISSKN